MPCRCKNKSGFVLSSHLDVAAQARVRIDQRFASLSPDSAQPPQAIHFISKCETGRLRASLLCLITKEPLHPEKIASQRALAPPRCSPFLMNPGEIEVVDDPAEVAAAREAYA